MSLVIIGSGLAGYMLAKEWRKLDADSPLKIITADDGNFYSKPMLSTALTQQKTPEQLVISDMQTMAEELRADICPYSLVTAIDPVNNQITLQDRFLNFSKLVIAWGAETIQPPLSGDAVDCIQSVNNLMDYGNFRRWVQGKKNIVMLGSGLVGCEFANDLANAGYAVTIISPEKYPLSTVFPADLGQMLQTHLAQININWRLQQTVQSIHRDGDRFTLLLASGEHIITDGVFSAIGLRPRIDVARNAGIQVNRGIIVNRWLQTNFSQIFSLGDCAEVDGKVQMYVAPLLQCARALAKILNGIQEPVDFPIMPIVLKTPAFPLVFYPPPPTVVGEWHVEGETKHLRALFHDQAGQLRGFVLSGDKIRDKMPLAKQLAIVLGE